MPAVRVSRKAHPPRRTGRARESGRPAGGDRAGRNAPDRGRDHRRARMTDGLRSPAGSAHHRPGARRQRPRDARVARRRGLGAVRQAGREPTAQALLRLVGVRDLVLGIGAITTLKEQTMDAEWVGMGAAADAVDGLVSLVTPGLRPPRPLRVARRWRRGRGRSPRVAQARRRTRVPPPLEIDS